MGVAADEVERAVEKLLLAEDIPHRTPPLAGRPGVADLRAAQKLDAEIQPSSWPTSPRNSPSRGPNRDANRSQSSSEMPSRAGACASRSFGSGSGSP